MKCYKHPRVDAVGVCSECGQGICDKCAVKIGGKLYCKSDADKVFGAPKAKAPTIPAAPAAPKVQYEVTEELREESEKIVKVLKRKGFALDDFSWVVGEFVKAGWPEDDRTKLYALRWMGGFAEGGWGPQDIRRVIMKQGVPLPP